MSLLFIGIGVILVGTVCLFYPKIKDGVPWHAIYLICLPISVIGAIVDRDIDLLIFWCVLFLIIEVLKTTSKILDIILKRKVKEIEELQNSKKPKTKIIKDKTDE